MYQYIRVSYINEFKQIQALGISKKNKRIIFENQLESSSQSCKAYKINQSYLNQSWLNFKSFNQTYQKKNYSIFHKKHAYLHPQECYSKTLLYFTFHHLNRVFEVFKPQFNLSLLRNSSPLVLLSINLPFDYQQIIFHQPNLQQNNFFPILIRPLIIQNNQTNLMRYATSLLVIVSLVFLLQHSFVFSAVSQIACTPPKTYYNPRTRSCQCPLRCTQYFTQNADCTCDCLTPFVYDNSTSTCTCPLPLTYSQRTKTCQCRTRCEQPTFLNQQTCLCQCPPPLVLNPVTKACQCTPPLSYNPRTKTCQCRARCEQPKTLNQQTCLCQCPPPLVQNPITKVCQCTPPLSYNPRTKTCQCRTRCEQPKTLNQQTCSCQCPAPTVENPVTKVCQCSAPFVYNPRARSCDCRTRCNLPETLNAQTCGCDCLDPFIRNASGVCVCVTGTFNSRLRRCV